MVNVSATQVNVAFTVFGLHSVGRGKEPPADGSDHLGRVLPAAESRKAERLCQA